MMWVFNSVFGRSFDLLFFPFRHLNAWFGMAFISLLTGLLMLFVFRLTSNQEGIRKVKDKIKAHLLELRLFKDNMGVTMKAQGQILGANLRYIAYSTKPMLVMMVPLVLILIQLNLWFGYEPLRPGESAILKVKLEESVKPMELEALLEVPPGIEVETPPLRLEEQKEIDWRLRARAEGVHELALKIGGHSLAKSVAVGRGSLDRISPVKVKRRFFEEVLNPGEKPFPSQVPVKSVEVAYPPKRMIFLGLRLHWLIAYFALSVLFGFALKRPFKVEI
jgi:uncharacterized membrane protein (DUF106 family)